LANAVGGAAVGGLLGALIGLGIPQEDARYYEEELHSGRTLITVLSEGRAAEAAAILVQNGGEIKTGGNPSSYTRATVL
jgi:hypothetical protein